MSILKQAEELKLTPDNLLNVREIVRRNVIDTYKSIFSSIKHLHEGMSEVLNMLNELDLLGKNESEGKEPNKINDLMKQLLAQMQEDGMDKDGDLSKLANKTILNDNKLAIINFSDIKKTNDSFNSIQDAFALSLKDTSGNVLEANETTEDDVMKGLAPENSLKVNVKDLDFKSLKLAVQNNKESFYEFVDNNLEVYKVMITRLSNLNPEDVKESKNLNNEMIEQLIDTFNQIPEGLQSHKDGYNDIAKDVISGIELYEKFDFLTDIIS